MNDIQNVAIIQAEDQMWQVLLLMSPLFNPEPFPPQHAPAAAISTAHARVCARGWEGGEGVCVCA